MLAVFLFTLWLPTKGLLYMPVLSMLSQAVRIKKIKTLFQILSEKSDIQITSGARFLFFSN